MVRIPLTAVNHDDPRSVPVREGFGFYYNKLVCTA